MAHSTRREFVGLAFASGAMLVQRQSLAALLQVTNTAELQPFAAQVRRLQDALIAVGNPLDNSELEAMHAGAALQDPSAAVAAMSAVLDRRVLLEVRINPEARLSVSHGAAPASLLQGGWRTFLVRVVNEGGVTAPLQIRSPQGGRTGRLSSLAIEGVHDFTNGAVDAEEARERWIALSTYDLPPMAPTLSGLGLEYRLLQIYSRDAGKREAGLTADAGFGEQDLGFRSTLPVLFHCAPAMRVQVAILDEEGRPTTASLLIRDSLHRVYPAQGKRDLPDLAFEPQIYRSNGEELLLASGDYNLEFGRGPEYLRGSMPLHVARDGQVLELRLQRWVTPSQLGYYSGDTHIHAAGCSHYESPAEGVPPEVMARQVAGEALDVGAVLNWGPGFSYQRQFFSGHALPSVAEHSDMQMGHLNTVGRTGPVFGSGLLRYDVEVSGFPSSHCGHLVLLRLKEDTYPGTRAIVEWPSWNLPILRWAKRQGGVTGYAHVGHGLVVNTTELPNYVVPPFNSSGANELLVDITHPGSIDFLSGCDLWPFAELNIWYHVLSCGFRIAFAGETDFPCITDESVGGGRSYVRLRNGLGKGDEGYSAWLQALVEGDAYFGDGRSHIFAMNVASNGAEWKGGGIDRTLSLSQAGEIVVTAQVCALLAVDPDPPVSAIRESSPYKKPYWHLERARAQGTRRVRVDLVVNGYAVAHTEITADGTLQPIRFAHPLERSSWVALRIDPSSHTNPAWIAVHDAPVRPSKRSALWCRRSVDACWEQKRSRIRPQELPEAAAAYDHARLVYDSIVAESHSDGSADDIHLASPGLPVT